jgi:hypothetical protein
VTEPPTEDFGPTRVASIDTATAGSLIANATSTLPEFVGFWRTRLCCERHVKTRKDTRPPVAPPNVAEIWLSACDLVLW